jgi:hypothetical protein
LTAGAPIFRGYLADVDVRWNIISQSVDDRTPEERGEVVHKNTFSNFFHSYLYFTSQFSLLILVVFD